MDLWIRSQDKKQLIEVDKIYLDDYQHNSGCHECRIVTYDDILGTYKTEARALEVLNEIQGKLKGTFLMKMKNNAYQKVIPAVKQYFEELNSVCIVTGDENFNLEPINKDIYVYEMPEE